MQFAVERVCGSLLVIGTGLLVCSGIVRPKATQADFDARYPVKKDD